MLFSCSIGSKGIEVDKTFSIYVPLVFSNGNEIKIEEGKFEGFLNGHRCILEKHNYLYSLKVEGFASREDSIDFIDRLKVAISWFILKRTTGVRFPDQISEVKLYESPIVVSDESDLKGVFNHAGWSETDGDYNADQLVIIQEEKRLTRWETGKAVVKLSYKPSGIIADIDECLSFETIDELLTNKKLRVAIDLFSAYKFENTTTGRFVKLVTVLEALLPEEEVSPNANEALSAAKTAIKSYRQSLKKTGENIDDIEHLLSRFGQLKYKSIGANLVEYIKEVLEKSPDLGDPSEIIPKIREIYSARSTLLHTGEYDEQLVADYVSVLAALVPGILKANFGVAE